MKLSPSFIAPFATVLYRLWCSTLRVNEVGREQADALWKNDVPLVTVMWHDEIFAIIHARKKLRLVTIVSQSKDGEYLARLLQSLRIRPVRGSSSRGGLGALLKVARLMRDERLSCAISVDGPRGPRHVAKQGAVVLAHRVPAKIVPIRAFFERAVVFNSWDRFQLPKPFSKVHVVFGAPYDLKAQALDPESLEAERLEVERQLAALCPPPEAKLSKTRSGDAI